MLYALLGKNRVANTEKITEIEYKREKIENHGKQCYLQLKKEEKNENHCFNLEYFNPSSPKGGLYQPP